MEGRACEPGEWYAAQLQSLGFVERWGYETLEKCGVPIGNVIFSSGEAAKSRVLLTLRSNILGRTVVRTSHPTAAFGAAVLAASSVAFGGDVCAATQAMTMLEETFTPSGTFVREFDEIYRAFRAACARRGYVT
jgi:sugar (pentulose or hexulose) kinase